MHSTSTLTPRTLALATVLLLSLACGGAMAPDAQMEPDAPTLTDLSTAQLLERAHERVEKKDIEGSREARDLATRRAESENEGSSYAAELAFLDGEILRLESDLIKLDSSEPDTMETRLKERVRLLKKAHHAYENAIAYEDPMWTAASLFRIGQSHEDFAQMIRSIDAPKPLTDEQREKYDQLLDDKAREIEQSAYTFYMKVAVVESNSGSVSRWGERAKTRAAHLKSTLGL